MGCGGNLPQFKKSMYQWLPPFQFKKRPKDFLLYLFLILNILFLDIVQLKK